MSNQNYKKKVIHSGFIYENDNYVLFEHVDEKEKNKNKNKILKNTELTFQVDAKPKPVLKYKPIIKEKKELKPKVLKKKEKEIKPKVDIKYKKEIKPKPEIKPKIKVKTLSELKAKTELKPRPILKPNENRMHKIEIKTNSNSPREMLDNYRYYEDKSLRDERHEGKVKHKRKSKPKGKEVPFDIEYFKKHKSISPNNSSRNYSNERKTNPTSIYRAKHTSINLTYEEPIKKNYNFSSNTSRNYSNEKKIKPKPNYQSNISNYKPNKDSSKQKKNISYNNPMKSYSNEKKEKPQKVYHQKNPSTNQIYKDSFLKRPIFSPNTYKPVNQNKKTYVYQTNKDNAKKPNLFHTKNSNINYSKEKKEKEIKVIHHDKKSPFNQNNQTYIGSIKKKNHISPTNSLRSYSNEKKTKKTQVYHVKHPSINKKEKTLIRNNTNYSQNLSQRSSNNKIETKPKQINHSIKTYISTSPTSSFSQKNKEAVGYIKFLETCPTCGGPWGKYEVYDKNEHMPYYTGSKQVIRELFTEPKYSPKKYNTNYELNTEKLRGGKKINSFSLKPVDPDFNYKYKETVNILKTKRNDSKTFHYRKDGSYSGEY